jgi:hypothetical protein
MLKRKYAHDDGIMAKLDSYEIQIEAPPTER